MICFLRSFHSYYCDLFMTQCLSDFVVGLSRRFSFHGTCLWPGMFFSALPFCWSSMITLSIGGTLCFIVFDSCLTYLDAFSRYVLETPGKFQLAPQDLWWELLFRRLKCFQDLLIAIYAHHYFYRRIFWKWILLPYWKKMEYYSKRLSSMYIF